MFSAKSTHNNYVFHYLMLNYNNNQVLSDQVRSIILFTCHSGRIKVKVSEILYIIRLMFTNSSSDLLDLSFFIKLKIIQSTLLSSSFPYLCLCLNHLNLLSVIIPLIATLTLFLLSLCKKLFTVVEYNQVSKCNTLNKYTHNKKDLKVGQLRDNTTKGDLKINLY